AGIGRTRSASDEAYARPARHRSIGASHVRCAALLAASHRLNGTGIMEGVEHRQETLAGNGEDAVAALADKAIDEQVRGATESGFIHYRPLAGRASRGNAILVCRLRGAAVRKLKCPV